MGIYVKNISKRFHQTDVLRNINLEVKPGELVALLGPSGSGKTTLLRIIAGLELADNGEVFLDNEDVNNKHIKDRNVGFVFQHYALFKNMTVFENVAFGLKVRPRSIRPSKEAIYDKVMKLLKLIHLDNFHDRYPSELSGGQRQRVALARSLAVEPKYLLLDEPFGALDAKVRKELRSWLRKLHNNIDVTTIFVTHDQQEAMEVADKIVIMSNGQIEQIGSPGDIYNHPKNMFVYDFFDNYNQFQGWQDDSGEIYLLDEDEKSETTLTPNKPFPKSKLLIDLYPEAANFLGKISFGFFSRKHHSPHNQPTIRIRKKPDNDTKIINIYARPYEMEVTKHKDHHQYIKTKVVHINVAGFSVKLELESEHGKAIQAEILRETFAKMKISKNDLLYVRPLTVKVFDRK